MASALNPLDARALVAGGEFVMGVRVLLGACVRHNQLDVNNYFYFEGVLRKCRL